jgi:zinc/manganese transport system permease protein
VAISIGVALFATWAGLFVAWYEPYPVSFFITSLVFGVYLVVGFAGWISARIAPRGVAEVETQPASPRGPETA